MATRPVEVATGVPALAPSGPSVAQATKTRLSNGLEVILAEAHAIPKFTANCFSAPATQRPRIALRARGNDRTVVRTGTAKRASRQIEEDLRRIGADLSSAAGADTSAISFSGLSEFAEPLLGMVNELAAKPRFPKANSSANVARTRGSKTRAQPAQLPRDRTPAKSFVRRASLRPSFAHRGASCRVQARRIAIGLPRILHA